MSNANLVCANTKAEVKDVVVIGKSFFKNVSKLSLSTLDFLGNGPSAITLSYLLSGHVPYYRGNSSDDFLHLRLSESIDQPLVLQDLEFLSDVSNILPRLVSLKISFSLLGSGTGRTVNESCLGAF